MAGRLRLPCLRRRKGLGACGQEVHLGMQRLWSTDLGHGWHCHASVEVAVDALVAATRTASPPFSFKPNSASAAYKTAWLMLHKLRRAMVDPDRTPLLDLVEVDETEIPYRTKDDPVAGGQGRSHVGKLLVIGAIELSEEGQPRRIRLEPLHDFTAVTITGFVGRVVEPGATVISDRLASYRSLKDHNHQAKVVGPIPAHVLLPWIHRVFSNFKRWALGTYHGIRRKHLHRYLDEFVYRWNRRRHMRSSFDTLLGLSMRLSHASYREFVGQTT
jgi:transposase-like protein